MLLIFNKQSHKMRHSASKITLNDIKINSTFEDKKEKCLNEIETTIV